MDFFDWLLCLVWVCVGVVLGFLCCSDTWFWPHRKKKSLVFVLVLDHISTTVSPPSKV